MLRSLCCLVALVAASPVLAQTTWIVDSANRPGANFTDLPPALAVAQADDTVVVRDGRYSGGATMAGIRLLFEPNGVLAGDQTLTVHDLPANERFLVEDLGRYRTGFEKPVFVARRCQGAVVVERLSLSEWWQLDVTTARIELEDCAQVSLSGCSVIGGAPVVSCVRSQVSITDSLLQGPPFPAGAWHPTCLVQDGTLVLGETEVRGTRSYENRYAVGVGLRAERSVVVATGSGAKPIAQGFLCTPQLSNGNCRPAGPGTPPAIESVGSLVVVDPRIPVIGGAPGVIRLGVPALVAAGAPLGGTLQTTLWPHTQGNVALLAGVPTAPAPTPFGSLWLGLDHVVLYLQTAATNTAIPFAMAVGPGLYPYERCLTLQAVELDLQGNLRLSNPASVILL